MKPIVPSDDSSPVSKIRKYAGPSTHKAILRKIHEELKAEGKEVPPHYILMVVVRFFSSIGIFHYTRNFLSVRIKGFGTLKRTRYVKPKDGIYKKEAWRTKKRKSYSRKKRKRLAFHSHYIAYKTNNRRRLRNDLEPITLKHYIKINLLYQHSKKMIEMEKKDLKL